MELPTGMELATVNGAFNKSNSSTPFSINVHNVT